MIYISELSKTFSGQKVLNNLSLEIQKGGSRGPNRVFGSW